MADILSVRQFTHLFRKLKPGQQVVVVDAARKKVLAAFTVDEAPEEIEKQVTQIFRR